MDTFFLNFTVEMQVRETTYGQVSKLSALQQQKTDAKSHTVHTPSGQSLFEIHIQKANLTKECLLQLGTNEPLIFATWTFYEHDMQYTPVIKGPQALLDCSAYYKVKLDDAFLDFLMDSSVMVEIHMTSNTGGDATDEQCKTVGKAELKLAEVVHYPSNKLHGSVLINSSPISGSHRYIVFDTNRLYLSIEIVPVKVGPSLLMHSAALGSMSPSRGLTRKKFTRLNIIIGIIQRYI